MSKCVLNELFFCSYKVEECKHMPKPLVNNKIIYPNIYGRVIQHDLWLDQSVQAGSSPTFANLHLSGSATIEGNLYVKGNSTVLSSNVIEFEDNIILINHLETGAGVTLNQAGFEIERGTLENYRVVYNEGDETLRAGVISNTQALATRQDNPLNNGVMTWNPVEKRVDSSDTIVIPLTFASTTQSTSVSTGALTIAGGLGIAKNMHVGGTTHFHDGNNHTSESLMWMDNSLNIISSGDVLMTPFDKVQLTFNKRLCFGSTEQSISANSITKDVEIYGGGNVFFYLGTNKRISIPNQIPITFSTVNEKVYTDSSNNMVIESGQDIHLLPGATKRVFIPTNTPIAFSNANQQISANLNNDMNIIAGNNINLSPGTGLDVRIPTDCSIKFGGSGNQKIFADNTNNLFITSSGDVNISTSNINIPSQVPMRFANPSQYIVSDGLGKLFIAAQNSVQVDAQLVVTNSSDATSLTTGAIITSGGITAQKQIYTESGIVVSSNANNALRVQKPNSTQSTMVVSTISSGSVSIVAGDANTSVFNLTSTSTTHFANLIRLSTIVDTTPGYDIGRGKSTMYDGRVFNVNLPSYDSYGETGERPKFLITSNNASAELFSVESDTGKITSFGEFGVTNTNPAVNATTASFVVFGGLGVVKGIKSDGALHARTSNTSALWITDANEETALSVNTVNMQTLLNTNLSVNNTNGTSFDVNGDFTVNTSTHVNRLMTHLTNTTNAVDTSTGALIVTGGVSVQKRLFVGEQGSFMNGINMNNTTIQNLPIPTNPYDAAPKAYVDLVKQGLFVKDAVNVATTIAGNLLTDFVPDNVIDGYVLQLGDRVLIKDQLDQVENGIYVVQASGLPLRANDFATGLGAAGAFTFILSGDLNGSLGWICVSEPNFDIVDTHAISFTQFTGLGQVFPGAALSKTLNQLDVNVDNSSIEIVSDALRIKSSAVSTGLTGGSGIPLQTSSDQSHVTQLGTINSGVWQGSTVQVVYGGTGRTQLPSGNILVGNGTNSLITSSKLFFDNTQDRLGVGTNVPSYTLHAQNTESAVVFLNANSDNVSPLGKPQILMSNAGVTQAKIGVSRIDGDIANNTYPDSLVVDSSIIHLATQEQSRITILADGSVGINCTNPTAQLHVDGGLYVTETINCRSTQNASNSSQGALIVSGGASIGKNTHIGGQLRIYNTQPSTNVNAGAVLIDGGLSISGNVNAANLGNGGALTVAGGASIGGDLYIGGEINGSGSSSSTFAYLTLTATDEAINLTTGSLVTFGGVTIQATTNATSVTNGGGLLVAGGASVNSDMYIGGTQYVYGSAHLYAPQIEVITIHSPLDEAPVFSIDRDTSTQDFSISRYSSGLYVESPIVINYSNGQTTFNNTTGGVVVAGNVRILADTECTSLTSGALSSSGGQSIGKNLKVGGVVSIFSTNESTSVTNGSLVVNGGMGVSKNVNVGGTLSVQQDAYIAGSLHYNGNSFNTTLNNTSGSALWYYFGVINSQTDAYAQVNVSNGVDASIPNNIHELSFIMSINGTDTSFVHRHTGNIVQSSNVKSDFFVYQDSTTCHLFLSCPTSSVTNVNVMGHVGGAFSIQNEGTGSEPNGIYSTFDNNTWIPVYTTRQDSNLDVSTGDLSVQGAKMVVAANLPVVGYNNSTTLGTRAIGTVYQRFQKSNNQGLGDVVNQQPIVTVTLPDQSTCTSQQVKLSVSASALDDFYVGWWIKVFDGTNADQTRQIVAYNGSQRVAQLSEPWSVQNPAEDDTLYIYHSAVIAQYFDESNNTFKLAYGSMTSSSDIQHNQDCDLQLAALNCTDPILSVVAAGAIRINNSADATSATSGGSFTTLGGLGITKKVHVGDKVVIGPPTANSESLCVNHINSTVRLSHSSGHAYIDFANNNTTTAFGLCGTADTLAITTTITGDSPVDASKALVVNTNGFIGINTTTANTALSIASNNLVSSSDKTGYLGMIASNTSTGSKIIMYGDDSITDAGNVQCHTGTLGSFSVYTNNVKGLDVDSSSVVQLFCTSNTNNSTSGALIVSGGVAVATTRNSISTINGGALTVAGGAAFAKDIHIGGNLYVSGNVNANGSALPPTITFTNTQGCSVITYGNNYLLNVSSEITLSFYVEVTPSAASQNCQFEFVLPDRATNLANRCDIIAMCNGYTDDTNVIPLFNTLCVGVSGETRGLVKFQSVSTGIHYLSILCRYTAV